MIIVSRAQWGARPPKSTPVKVSPTARRYFVVHHSGGPVTQTVRAIQDWCMDGRGFNDIDYNHLVRGSDGTIYEGRGWDIQGAHTEGYNTSGVGVCVIGTDTISDAAKRSVLWLLLEYNRRCARTLTIKGHRDLATTGTTCPGDRVYAWVRAGMPAPMEDDMSEVVKGIQAACKAAGFDPGTVDGAWGPKTQAALTAALRSVGPAGPRGPQGPAGPAGTLPPRVTLTGDIRPV